ncbi:hypothetical protein RP726_15125 [Candidatus Methylospira mobilis]|uniref:hypothetical protein n=1 Tax=Candidatus Methylospira mobilis TaxID=1808979 RepID=UPI0028F01723|nr:hypothetical protein [Candidatus Methylospira mobilis]WNV03757.1 hypothetical protein RP726_15125 [Candidatus Methylospira mobilis]
MLYSFIATPAFFLAGLKSGLRSCLATGLLLPLFSMPAYGDWAGMSRFQAVIEVNVSDAQADVGVRISDNSLPAMAEIPEIAQSCPPALPANVRIGCFGLRLVNMLGEDIWLTAGSAPPVAVSENVGSVKVWESAMVYPIPHKLKSLTLTSAVFTQDKTHRNGQLSLGLIVTHQGIPVSDLMAFEHPLTVSFNWNDAWETHFDDSSRVRHHAAPRSWIYLEPLEVRHEILIRLSGVRDWLPDSLKAELNAGALNAALRQRLVEALAPRLLQRNPMVLDGITVLPQLDRIGFVSFSRQGIVPLDDNSRQDADNALLGVVLAYFVDKPVTSLSLTWDFSGAPRIAHALRSFTILQGRETLDADVSIEQPLLSWSSEEMMEPLSAAGEDYSALEIKSGEQPASETDRVKAILAALLHNAYRAFQLREENAVYDRLANSLDGDILDEIYLQQRRALLKQARGLGGEGKVSRVELLDLQLQDKGKFPQYYDVTARWQVEGVVSHWGHAHDRRNLYEARLRLATSSEGEWRITQLTSLDGRRLVGYESQ